MTQELSTVPGEQTGVAVPQALRLGWAVAIVVVYWLVFWALGQQSMFEFFRFLWRMGALLLLIAVFLVWWFSRRRYAWRERWLVLGAMIGWATISVVMLDRSVLPPALLLYTIPAVFTLWTIWLALRVESNGRARLIGMLLIPLLCFAPMTLFRQEGMRGDGRADLHWRFSPSAEQQFLAHGSTAATTMNPSKKVHAASLVAAPDDWPEFRGPKRDATVYGLRIATDWSTRPPRLKWRRSVGPAWSSIVVVANRIFTQEQRGDVETASCFDADTGEEIWVHADPGRFEEHLGGIGPRATPTFDDGKLYTLGARGRLQAFDAASGHRLWARSIVEDSGASIPAWGFASSPLVTDGRLIVFAGNEDATAPTQRHLLAYDIADGSLLWTAPAGATSYSSAQLHWRDGAAHIVFLGDKQLTALDPVTGEELWHFASDYALGRPTLQPRFLDEDRFLVSFSPDPGISLVELRGAAGQVQSALKWSSRGLKPDFNDFVHHDGAIYGFDGAIFGCLDLESGKRNWKGGRYGAGQVLLLADQPLLLVLSESGELVLVAADPTKHRELARLPAISGKTWNHPALAGNRLYVRSAEEMACLELAVE